MAQPVDLVVYRAVLFDVGVARWDVRLGLVIVVVADEVLDPVVGKISRISLANWAASDLFGAMISVGRCTCSMVQAMVALLPLPGDAEQGLEAVTPLDALGQASYGFGLVAGR